jgi:hypothetical protein
MIVECAFVTIEDTEGALSVKEILTLTISKIA